ncbi:MAG: ATP-binding cassette domain-containing protein [Pseudomonadota bacterium]
MHAGDSLAPDAAKLIGEGSLIDDRASEGASPAAIAALNLVKRHAGRSVLAGASAVFRRGELTAILGRRGAGRTTLASILAGQRMADAGRVWRAGAVAPLVGHSAGFGATGSVRRDLGLRAAASGLDGRYFACAVAAELDDARILDRPFERLEGADRAALCHAAAWLVPASVYIADGGLVPSAGPGADAMAARLAQRRRDATVIWLSAGVSTLRAMAPDRILLLEAGTLRPLADIAEAIRLFDDRRRTRSRPARALLPAPGAIEPAGADGTDGTEDRKTDAAMRPHPPAAHRKEENANAPKPTAKNTPDMAPESEPSANRQAEEPVSPPRLKLALDALIASTATSTPPSTGREHGATSKTQPEVQEQRPRSPEKRRPGPNPPKLSEEAPPVLSTRSILRLSPEDTAPAPIPATPAVLRDRPQDAASKQHADDIRGMGGATPCDEGAAVMPPAYRTLFKGRRPRIAPEDGESIASDAIAETAARERSERASDTPSAEPIKASAARRAAPVP